MKSRIFRLTLSVSFILFSILPLNAIKKDTKLLLAELQKISDSILKLEKKVNALSSDYSALFKKVKIIDNKLTAVTKNQADEGQNKETISLSLQFLKEEINTLKNNLSKVYDRLIQIPTSSVKSLTGTDSSEGITGDNSAIDTPDNIYYTAYSDYIKKNYKLAISGFTQFLKYYPKNALADNSLYWIGECYYAQKEYKNSISSFSKLISEYSDGDKVPDALLKMGYALIETGNNDEGLKVLKKLVKKYPLSEEASLAQQKIRDVND